MKETYLKTAVIHWHINLPFLSLVEECHSLHRGSPLLLQSLQQSLQCAACIYNILYLQATKVARKGNLALFNCSDTSLQR